MSDCVYPGSFDPVTKGHVDIIARTARLFDKVYVAVLNNTAKRYMFDLDARCAMMERVTRGMGNIEVVSSDGLLANLMDRLGTKTIVRGLRSNADLEHEQQLAVANARLLDGAETVVLLSKPEMQYVSSSIVKELIQHRADVGDYVPPEALDIINGGKPHENT
jgi:pantetheine-phosphate adenylyltransferase